MQSARGSVDGTDLAPVVEIRTVLPEQWQKHTVQLIKFKQAGQMIVCLSAKIVHRFAFSSNRPTNGHDLLLLYHASPKQKRGGLFPHGIQLLQPDPERKPLCGKIDLRVPPPSL